MGTRGEAMGCDVAQCSPHIQGSLAAIPSLKKHGVVVQPVITEFKRLGQESKEFKVFLSYSEFQTNLG